ncbi:MAG: hypothetical protein P8Q36_07085 [Alphaproteobacteria bacterium]|jgi:hypothetical protein|nr:hypothetical protein [Rhodospirillaceae bacterium]MBT6202201.1 hypothetical protein [Rhodospirillaceae bacterium]MBT6511196.1 hypothetical protein [Rhodospirillaceae bacterium]MBT7647504.1 hypothetical protein [Rhodospirillaceae bacterium]MDG2480618.1 hypothetical protein [Alphaproteobacteria bacterium]
MKPGGSSGSNWCLLWLAAATVILQSCSTNGGSGIFDARYDATGRYADSENVFVGEALLEGSGKLTLVLANKQQLAGFILDTLLEEEVNETNTEHLLSIGRDEDLTDAVTCIGVLEGDMSTSLAIFEGLLICTDQEQPMLVTLFRFGGGSMRGLAGGDDAADRFSVMVNAGTSKFVEWSSDVLEDKIPGDALVWP